MPHRIPLPPAVPSGARVLPGRLAPAAMYPAGDPAVTSRFVTLASGLRVRVLECGAATGPAVVLLHGWCCSAFSFRRNLRVLTERGCRVVVPDLKGHGLSEKPRGGPGEYTLAGMADHALAIMDAVGVARAALVGHSMGGAIAAAVALRAPERVSRLALIAPVGFGAVSVLSLARALTPPALTPLLPYLVRRWMIAAVLRVAYARAGVTARDVDEYFAPTQFPGFTRAMRTLLHDFEWAPGARADLERLTAPTLVMFGTRDRLVYRPSVEALVHAIPHVRLDLVEGGGHVLPESAAERVNARLAEFIAGAEDLAVA